MCDFLSTIVRADGVLYHDPSNSHSSMIAKCGWRENQPNRKPFFVEAEWDCEGEYPGAEKVCRVPDGEKLTKGQISAVDKFYKSVAAFLKLKNPTMEELEPWNRVEYADILGRVRPEGLPKGLTVWHGNLVAYNGSITAPELTEVGGYVRAYNGSKLDLPKVTK